MQFFFYLQYNTALPADVNVSVTVFNCSVCGARLVTAIRAVLVKGRSSGEEFFAAAEETTKELKERICQIHQIQKQTTNGSNTGISPARVMYSLYSSATQPQF